MKTIAAAYVVFNDTQYLEMSIKSIYDGVSKIYILANTKPWRGDYPLHNNVPGDLLALANKYKKIEIVNGTWDHEHEQRNFGLQLCRNDGYDYCLVIDTDEVYSENSVRNMSALVNNPENSEVSVYTVSWEVYWKIFPLHKIEPRESFTLPVLVSATDYSFTDKRSGQTRSGSKKVGLIPENLALMHHLSYAREDSYVKEKLASFSHSHEVVEDWYEKVWLKWTPDMQNLNPAFPTAYGKAVPVKLETLPKVMRLHFKQFSEATKWLPDDLSTLKGFL